jgi:hypothetical protein
LTFRSRFVPLFVVSRKRAGARSRVLSTPYGTGSTHRICIRASVFAGCAEIILNVV